MARFNPTFTEQELAGPYSPKTQVNHKDGNKQNPRPGNLEYGT